MWCKWLARVPAAWKHCINSQSMLAAWQSHLEVADSLLQSLCAALQWLAPASSLAGSCACGWGSFRQALRSCTAKYAHLHQPEVISSHRHRAQPGLDAEHIIAALRRAGHHGK